MNFLTHSKSFFLAKSWVSFAVKIFIGAQIMALMAQISIPIGPVPITGQTLGLTIIGFALGARAATASIALYLYEGLIGFPVFSNGGSGFAHLFGPSGGYLVAYLPSAWVLGYASDKGCLKSLPLSFLVAVLSAVITFAGGLYHLNKFMPSWEVTLAKGLYPFILGGIIKAILASVLIVPAYKFFKKI